MCLETWPNVQGSNRDGTMLILDSLELVEHVAFGNTKIFIRTPQTLAELENTRAISLPDVVKIIQRVLVIISSVVLCPCDVSIWFVALVNFVSGHQFIEGYYENCFCLLSTTLLIV